MQQGLNSYPFQEYLKLKWNAVHQLVTNCTHLFLSKHQASHKESEMFEIMIRNITVREYW